MQTDLFSQKLAREYSHFDVSNRLLFTGHSHQAWPDVALDGVIESFDVAAREVDTKWDTVFRKIGVMRDYLKTYYDDPNGGYTHGENTHNFFTRWLSGLDIQRKRTIITTDAEFYSIGRQLRRLEEEGIRIIRVPALPIEGFAERFNEVLSGSDVVSDVLCVMISRVYFETGLINNELPEVGTICRNHDIPLLIDDYHGTNVVPLSLRESELEHAFVLIGGYKYLQWGEGNCFLRFPKDCSMRPLLTGWFSGFSSLKEAQKSGPVPYDDGDLRFAGATFDGVSAFRGAAVVGFFEENGLTAGVLRKMYAEQVAHMKFRFLSLDLDPAVLRVTHDRPVNENGGFLSLTGEKATQYWHELKDRGVLTDCRGDILRMGPAPYIVSAQIEEAMTVLGSVVEGIG